MTTKPASKNAKRPRPHFIKDSLGRTTHVFLPIDLYKKFERDLKKYKRLQEQGVEWTEVTLNPPE